ncbi:MAG TPA: hypothetical protein VFS21_27535 [Roseiflexaceae bacterium]|nr:hypothetical protein [Roseiflexaceae bacterium]
MTAQIHSDTTALSVNVAAKIPYLSGQELQLAGLLHLLEQLADVFPAPLDGLPDNALLPGQLYAAVLMRLAYHYETQHTPAGAPPSTRTVEEALHALCGHLRADGWDGWLDMRIADME